MLSSNIKFMSAMAPSSSSDDKKKGSKGFARFAGSAVAGATELMLFHPVDTIAKRLMSNTDNTLGLNRIIFKDAADKSVLTRFGSLFPGVGFAAGYKVLQRTYKFGFQPYVKDFLDSYCGDSFRASFGKKQGEALMHATAGSLIGIGEILLLPLDVLKIKAQTNPDALKGYNLLSIFWKEGRNLYRGAGWTAARNAPGSFALFGGASWVYGHLYHLENQKQATFFQTFVASTVGSIASILVSQPLDVIKTRIQKANFDQPVGGLTVFSTMMKEEGPSALLKGVIPKLVVVGPKLVFSFSVAQYLINMIEKSF